MTQTNHFAEPSVPYRGPPTQQKMSEAEWVFLVRMRMRAERNRNHALAATTFVTIFIMVVTGWHLRGSEAETLFALLQLPVFALGTLGCIAYIYVAFTRYIDEVVAGIDEMLRENETRVG